MVFSSTASTASSPIQAATISCLRIAEAIRCLSLHLVSSPTTHSDIQASSPSRSISFIMSALCSRTFRGSYFSLST